MNKKILFVCVENAGRSQIAEAFFKKYAPKKYQVISAGTQPSAKVNPVVVQVMKEVGIEMQDSEPKLLTDEIIKEASSTVNMGCINQEACPALFVKDILDWNIADPKGKSVEDVRKIRDQIEAKVKEFVKNLEG